ncbi:MAG: RNA ligase family protein [Patescibacteria group bacterium]
MNSKKFPRIPHFPWSPGGTKDDRRLNNVEHLLGKEIVVSEKVDGSNLCFTQEEVYARTHATKATHKSFDAAKAKHAELRSNIDAGISIFGEWVFCVHSIEYSRLPDYFLVFGVRDDNENVFYSWDLLNEYSKNLGLVVVKLLFQGVVNSEEELEKLTVELATQQSEYGEDKREGVVVRVSRDIIDFYISTAKWVRKDHPKDPDEHWMFKPIVKQRLINGNKD